MTDQLLSKLEEKIIALLAESEFLRAEVGRLRTENNSLRAEKLSSTDKLKELINQLDDLIAPAAPVVISDSSLYSEKFAVPA